MCLFYPASYNDLNYIKKNTLTEPLWINNLNNIKNKNKNLIKIINLAEFLKMNQKVIFTIVIFITIQKQILLFQM